MKRFHMKRDQSGAALCTAVERSCPNGEFGHYDSQYEVLMAYEHAINEGKVPGLATLTSLKREEISASREELERDSLKRISTFIALRSSDSRMPSLAPFWKSS